MTIHSKFGILGLVTTLAVTGGAMAQGNQRLFTYLQALPMEAVSFAEQQLLVHMREEEKLARDVYRVLDQQWHLPAFANIANSEQSHMDLIAFALQRYQIADPIPSNQVGAFSNPGFTALFQTAITFGSISPLHALLVGAIIEDLDMVDLDYALVHTDNRDIDTIWQNLHRGSRNHMRSFHGQLGQLGLVYTGIYLTPQELQAIVTTPHEAGPVDEFGVPLP